MASDVERRRWTPLTHAHRGVKAKKRQKLGDCSLADDASLWLCNQDCTGNYAGQGFVPATGGGAIIITVVRMTSTRTSGWTPSIRSHHFIRHSFQFT